MTVPTKIEIRRVCVSIPPSDIFPDELRITTFVIG